MKERIMLTHEQPKEDNVIITHIHEFQNINTTLHPYGINKKKEKKIIIQNHTNYPLNATQQ